MIRDSYPQLSEPEVRGAITRISKGKILDLSFFPQMSDKAISKIAFSHPDLHTLNLSDCNQITPLGMRHIRHLCPELITVKNEEKSDDTHQWNLIKAARNGELGSYLIKHLLANHPNELSYAALEGAHQIAKTQNNQQTAAAIDACKAKIPKEKCSSNLEKKILLASSVNPSGYHPLGDLMLPPLTATELGLAETGLTEDQLFEYLYQLIVLGQTNLKIVPAGDAIPELFRTLLSTPSGRWLTLLACRSEQIVYLETGSQSGFISSLYLIRIYLPPIMCVNSDLNEFIAYPDSALFHELLHFLHFDQNPQLFNELTWMDPYDKNYTSLEEQYTIAGIDDDFKDLWEIGLCQNTYHFERGYPKRYGHKSRNCLATHLPFSKIVDDHNLPSKIGTTTEWTIIKPISKQEFLKVAPRCPNLQSLKFIHSPELTDEWAEIIALNFKNLKFLNLGTCQLTDNGLEKLQQCTLLETVHLVQNHSFSQEVVAQLLQKCTQIKKLFFAKSTAPNVFINKKRSFTIFES